MGGEQGPALLAAFQVPANRVFELGKTLVTVQIVHTKHESRFSCPEFVPAMHLAVRCYMYRRLSAVEKYRC